jgi:hypothetical protein
MVELIGKRSQFGVDEFLRQVKGETSFSDLLQSYDVSAPAIPVDPAERELDNLIQAVKREVAAARPRLIVTSAAEESLFDLRLEWGRAPR